MTDRHRRKGIAPRREVLILLPAALLVLVLLSIYALLSYRSAVELLIEERRAEAAQLARQLSTELAASRTLPAADALRRRLPQARSVAILDAGGALLAGDAASSPTRRRWPWSTAPAGENVAGTARFQSGAETLTLRVELPAAVLRSRQRSLDILSPVLLTVNGAITLLVLLFLRRFLAPIDRMVERARGVGREVPDSQDEVIFLVETFEKALEALERPAETPAAGGPTAGGPTAGGPTEVDELKALEKTLATSLESGVLLLDAQGTVLALNEIGSSLIEIAPGRTGEPLAAVLADQPRLAALLERAIERQRPVQRQECLIETSQGERTLGVTAHPLRRDDARLRGYLVMFADLTEVQQEVEQRQLADSLSQLGELTAGVAHELRNSLATLRGYLTLIERSSEKESIRDYLGEIRRESDHLKRVLEDFLMFARPGSTRPQEVDLLGLTHRAAADPALGEATVTVEAEGAGDELRVWGDPQLLERALRNVLSNAVEAQVESGCKKPVRVRVRSSATGVEVLVEDRGSGLSEEAREKLFDPFFSQRAGGVGLGLALTRRIVLLHAGRITLESRPAGGTRASFWMPRGKTVTKGNGSSSSESTELAGKEEAKY